MFTAYEAIHIRPDTFLDIKRKLNNDWPQWDELVTARMNQLEEFYIIFDFVKHNFEPPTHIVMPKSVVDRRCHVAEFNETLHWISEKK